MARALGRLVLIPLLAGCSAFRPAPTRMDNPRYVYYHPGFSALRVGMNRGQVVALLGEPHVRSDRTALEPLSKSQRERLLQEQEALGRAWNEEFAKAGLSRRLEALAARKKKIGERLARSVERWECRPPGWEGSAVLTFDESGKLLRFTCGMG